MDSLAFVMAWEKVKAAFVRARMAVKAFYKRNVHYLRALLAFVVLYVAQMYAMFTDPMLFSMPPKRVLVLAVLGAFVAFMRAGDFNGDGVPDKQQ